MSNKKPAAIDTRKDLKVNENVLRLADAIRSELKIGPSGVAEPLPKDFFEKNLPSGLSMSEVKKVDTYRTDLVSASALALGEASIDAFRGDKNLKQTSLTIGANKDELSVLCDLERSYPNRMGGKDAPDVVKHLNIQARYTTHAVGSRGDFQRVRAHMNGLGKELFS